MDNTVSIGEREDGTKYINSRELHIKLGINYRCHNDWVRDIIKSRKLVKNVDYVETLTNIYRPYAVDKNYPLVPTWEFNIETALSICIKIFEPSGFDIGCYILKYLEKKPAKQSERSHLLIYPKSNESHKEEIMLAPLIEINIYNNTHYVTLADVKQCTSENIYSTWSRLKKNNNLQDNKHFLKIKKGANYVTYISLPLAMQLCRIDKTVKRLQLYNYITDYIAINKITPRDFFLLIP